MATVEVMFGLVEVAEEVAPMSRRDALRRLGGLGLVAAGLVFAPVAATAKGSGHGKAKSHHRQGNYQRREPDGTEAEGRGSGKGHRGKGQGGGVNAELNLPDLPDPRVTASLSIGGKQNDNTYPVTVSGTISFDRELVGLMKGGRQFALSCELWNLDDNKLGSKRADIPLAAGSFNVFTTGLTRSFKFFDQRVSRDKLNEDTPSGCVPLFGCTNNDDTDELVGLLRLTTRRSGTGGWRTAPRANGLNYYLTSQRSGQF